MGKCFPKTIKELHGNSTMHLIRALIVDEMNLRCTNVEAPKYKELCKLNNWVSKRVPDKRVHDKS
jgi:hypothetical protein